MNNNFEKQLNNLPKAKLGRKTDLAIQAKIEEHFAQKEKKRAKLFPNFAFLFLRYAAVSVAVFLFAVIVGQYTYFSDQVVYGSQLYNFKQTMETIRLGMAKTSLQRVGVYSDFARRRLSEAETLARSQGQELSFNLIKTALAQGEALTPLTITLEAYEYNNEQALAAVEEMSAPAEIGTALGILETAQGDHEKKLETIAKEVGLENQDEVVVTVAVVLEETRSNKSRVQKAAKLVKETVETRASQGQATLALQIKLKSQEKPAQELGISDEEQKEQAKNKLALLSEEVQRLRNILETDSEISFEDQRALNILETGIQKTQENIDTGQVNAADELIQSTAAVKNNLIAFKKTEPTAYRFKTPEEESPSTSSGPAEEKNEESPKIALELPATTFKAEEPVLVLTGPEAVSAPTAANLGQNLKPDLIVAVGSHLTKEKTMQAIIKNIGEATASGLLVTKFYDLNSGFTYYDQRYVDLTPQKEYETDRINISNPGDYNFQITTDYYNAFDEMKEGNNTLDLAFSIDAIPGKLNVKINTSVQREIIPKEDRVSIASFMFSADQQEDLLIKGMKLSRHQGSINLQDLDLAFYIDGTLLNLQPQVGYNYLTFDDLNLLVPKNRTKTFTVEATVDDYLPGSSYTKLGFSTPQDITAIGLLSQKNAILTNNFPVLSDYFFIQPAQPEPVVPCAETDSGEDPNTKGTITGHWLCPEDGKPIVTETDYCLDSSHVNEYLCNGTSCDNILSTSIYCPYGCSDGACLKEPKPKPGTLKVSTSPASPAGQNLYPGDRDKSVTILRFQALDSDIDLHKFPVTKGQIYGDDDRDISKVKIYINGQFKKETTDDTKWPVFDFSSNPIHINKDGYVDVEIKIDVSATAPAGHWVTYGTTNNYQLAAYSTNNGELATIDAPQHVWGYQHTIVEPEVAEGKLRVSLASDTPAAQEIAAGEEAVVAKFNFMALDEAVKVEEITLTQGGGTSVSQYLDPQYIDSIKLYKDTADQNHLLGTSTPSSYYTKFIFGDQFVIDKNTGVNLIVKVAVDPEAPAQKQFSFSLHGGYIKAIGQESAKVLAVEGLSVYGKVMTVKRQPGSLIIENLPLSSTELKTGNSLVGKLEFTANQNEDIQINKLSFRQNLYDYEQDETYRLRTGSLIVYLTEDPISSEGSAEAVNDVFDIKLKDTWQKPITIAAGQSQILYLRAYIYNTGAQDTLNLQLTGVEAIGKSSGQAVGTSQLPISMPEFKKL